MNSCDVYVGIVAWRYGYIPEGHEYSITEIEYRAAQQVGKPCLIFLVDEDAHWRVSNVEVQAMGKLNAFRNTLQTSHVVAFFSSVDELSVHVAEAISNLDKKSNALLDVNHITIKRFEQEYRTQIIERYGYIIPPIYNAARRKFPLNSLYVTSRIFKVTEKTANTLQMFIPQIRRTVVLGSPGGGKSTLANKICVALNSEEKTEDEFPSIPALVILREYAERKKQYGDSVIDFLRYKATSDYQLVPPNDIFEQWLDQGRLLVIFDGLDELVETIDRQDIASAIESFGTRFPNARILVTCRKVGYEEAALDAKSFVVYELGDFEPSDVMEYVNKWFSLEKMLDHPNTDNLDEAKALLSELEEFPKELQTNPLILALICNIYQGEGYIPRNRSEIYRKCSELLLDRRDRERRIQYKLPIEGLVLSTIMHLASWICDNKERENGIVEDKLIALTAQYLQVRNFEDYGAAVHAARQFVEFCRGRAWIFTDTGTTKEGERIYQFTHRTFLEYYAALHIVRTKHTPEALYAYLEDRISRREMNTVCLIAFQQLAREIDGAADTLLELLLNSARSATGQGNTNFLMFAVETLESFIPKPHLVRTVTVDCLSAFLDGCVKRVEEEGVELQEVYFESTFSGDKVLNYYVFPKLARAAMENRNIISDSLEESLVERIIGSTDLIALLAAELLLMFSPSWSRREHSLEVLKFLNDITERAFKKCSNHIIEKLAPLSILIAVEMFEVELISLEQLVKLHGVPVLFEELYYVTIDGLYRGELAPTWLSDLCSENLSVDTQQRILKDIQESGKILLSMPTPWMTPYPRSDARMLNMCRNKLPSYDSDTLFGTFMILACMYEKWFSHSHSFFPASERFETLFPDYLYWVFIEHFSDQYVEDSMIVMETEKCGFSQKQTEFVIGWSSNQFQVLN